MKTCTSTCPHLFYQKETKKYEAETKKRDQQSQRFKTERHKTSVSNRNISITYGICKRLDRGVLHSLPKRQEKYEAGTKNRHQHSQFPERESSTKQMLFTSNNKLIEWYKAFYHSNRSGLWKSNLCTKNDTTD